MFVLLFFALRVSLLLDRLIGIKVDHNKTLFVNTNVLEIDN